MVEIIFLRVGAETPPYSALRDPPAERVRPRGDDGIGCYAPFVAARGID